ncbi:MAG: dipeptide ABC transporter ATP-binding protein [Mesorhizobium sp.]|uniref:ABC transporter ATP-binding protein n=1 Tax=Mesorhizobium sp. TaxID=1871066 RepID=UPI000FE6E5B7|nr:dipeptide ABC transporter ATP-binding protein [Mesorhizobium sp.]RWI54803.1 MAG: dipeptide ABC transporter ATP-binding protein [Mesorhizobium sp.]
MTDGGPPLLSVENVGKTYRVRGSWFSHRTELSALQDVSFTLRRGETLGIVGESGCGKSTLARIVTSLTNPTEGVVRFEGEPLTGISTKALWRRRRDMQMIFQDPYSSLNPRMTVGEIVGEPLLNYGLASRYERREKVASLLERVGLRGEHMVKYPHEFSGGQRQRISIARALVLGPKLVVADEPVAALDVSVQAQVMNLMRDLQQDLGLACIFITHDLAMANFISNSIAVMYLGWIVEIAPADALFANPSHPYSRALLSARPSAHPSRRGSQPVPRGEPPNPINPPSGCRYRDRCRHAVELCVTQRPQLREAASGHFVACHRHDDLSLSLQKEISV